MNLPEKTQKTFLQIVRKQLKLPELSLEEAIRQPLAQTLLDLLAGDEEEASQAPSPAAAPTPSLKDYAQSRAVIQAAIEDTFLLQELNPADAERDTLVANADVVMVNGTRRLRLTDAARAELITAAKNTDLYQDILREALKADARDFKAIGDDPVRLPSAWLRGFLADHFSNVERLPPKEATAALSARQRLRLVSDLPKSVPSIADLERHVAFADLLEPLCLLVGAQGGWDETPRRDRFVGRQSEMANLRAFVDEIASQSFGEAVSRGLAGAAGAAANFFLGTERPNLRVVQADGGLGKSALLAKFVLDHALSQKQPFPFAYIDFDRASLDASRPDHLLIEIARQVGLQFPAAQPEFDALAQEIRNPSSAPSTSNFSIRDPYAGFAEILRRHATQSQRAFLLVLDTLEVVQWNSPAMSGLSSMLIEFRIKGLAELRVVVSGRADVPELRMAAGVTTAADNIKLRALSFEEATQMAQRLGESAVGGAWNPSWSRAIAGEPRADGLFQTVKRILSPRDDIRREPLTVRVAVDLVLQADPDKRQAVVDDIRSMTDDGQKSLAARIYERRILYHVRDERAQKLAWPGLVLRRVTPVIARELLAPLCNLKSEDVLPAFEALANEVWMVTRDGDVLTHRPELRARTLPLMRANDQATFDRVATAAREYFKSNRERSREDRVEWIYHHLLVGGSLQEVAAEITPDIFSMLARAEDDFPPESETASYIASRTATSRLPPARIRRMHPNDALYHLKTTSQTVFGLDDTSIDQTALELSDHLSASPEVIGPELYPWARALWIKCGAWRRVIPEWFQEKSLAEPVLRAPLYWAARSWPSLRIPERNEILRECLRSIERPLSNAGDHVGFRTTVQAMTLARLGGDDAHRKLDARVTQMLSSMKPNPLPSLQAAVRTAIVFGDTCRGPALDFWLKTRRRGTIGRVQSATFAASELREFARIQPELQSLLFTMQLARGNVLARVADEQIVALASSWMEQCLATNLAGDDGQDLSRALARQFAHRDEDWIIPFAYAAERCTKGKYSDALRKRMQIYSEYPYARSSEGLPGWTDMLGAMRIADEAGDLPGLAEFVLSQCDASSAEAGDLAYLIDCRERWSQAIESILGGGGKDAPDAPQSTPPVSPSSGPPTPGPVLHKDDPQKDRWGGKSEREGRALHAVIESIEKEVFYFSLIVESTDGSTLDPPVVFHLHDSFPRSVIHIRRIVAGRSASINGWNAYGVFTAGVQVKDRNGSWTSLELDLATLSGLSKRFLER